MDFVLVDNFCKWLKIQRIRCKFRVYFARSVLQNDFLCRKMVKKCTFIVNNLVKSEKSSIFACFFAGRCAHACVM